jgi:secreted PhoX family phosphatase
MNGESAVPGMSHAEVLVFTRMAADQVRATPMDRCEDVQPSPLTGKVYVACTNNRDRGVDGEPAPDAANPREKSKNGHIIEIAERDNRVDATSFAWNLFLVCGDADEAGSYFGGWQGPVAPIHDRDESLFVCVQHPGEDGSWDSQLSFFPDYVQADAQAPVGSWRGPRPSVIQVTRDR